MSRVLRPRHSETTKTTTATTGSNTLSSKDIEPPTKKAKSNPPQSTKGSSSKVEIGDKIPKVTIKSQDGNEVDVTDVKGLLVLFSYPKASTPGCTRQTRGFGEHYNEFAALGATVYGISADSEKAQTTFKNKLELPFDLLSDPEYKLLGPLKAKKSPKGVVRSHWVFKDGILEFAENGVKPDTSPQRSLDAARKLNAEKEKSGDETEGETKAKTEAETETEIKTKTKTKTKNSGGDEAVNVKSDVEKAPETSEQA